MDWRASIGAAGLAALAFVLGGCTEARTELVVVIHSEIEEIDRVAIDVAAEDRTIQSFAVGVDGLASFPLTFGLTSRSHGDSLVRISVTGEVGGVDVVQAGARTRFVPHESRVLVIVLERACTGHAPCPAGETCRAGVCEDAYVPPSTLPRRSDVLPDAGVHAYADAGVDGGRDAGDAGTDAASCEGDGGVVGRPDGCILERWPARPRCGDTGDDRTVRHVAMIDPIFDQGGAWRGIGFDLDGLCTDPLVPGTPTECGVDGGTPAADGENGIDNAVGSVIGPTISSAFPDYQARAWNTMSEGRNVPVVRIAGWSGEDDDAHVAVWLAGSMDIVTASEAAPDGGTFDPTVPNANPIWDGTDVAYVSATYFAGGDEASPLIVDDNAYVAGRVLVAQLPDRAPIDLPVPSGIGRIRLTDTRLVAALDAAGTGFTDAVVVGRWAEADLFAYTDDLGFCPTDPMVAALLPVFRTLVQRSLDVRSIPGSGGTGVACNAMSTAVPFEIGHPVRFGAIVPTTFEPLGCP